MRESAPKKSKGHPPVFTKRVMTRVHPESKEACAIVRKSGTGVKKQAKITSEASFPKLEIITA